MGKPSAFEGLTDLNDGLGIWGLVVGGLAAGVGQETVN
jgi:hypothetical protein